MQLLLSLQEKGILPDGLSSLQMIFCPIVLV